MDALTDEQRAVLVLREFDDLAYDEIGEALNIRPGTVRSRLSRARTLLRETMEAMEAGIAS